MTNDPDGQPYQNVPLNADTAYRVSVAGRTADDPTLVATPWSGPIRTGLFNCYLGVCI